MGDSIEDLRRHFREALQADPIGAYRDWFRAQQELRERDDVATARALADDLWALLPELPFGPIEERARFFHNAAVFYGSPGPAADLARARDAFVVALEHFAADPESGWHARAHHNLATALANLGTTVEELSESVALFERALAWRTREREIARGVTLHNMGLALRRLAELDPAHEPAHLERSADALREAIAIRERHDLTEGSALSRHHLGITLEKLGSLPRTRARDNSQETR